MIVGDLDRSRKAHEHFARGLHRRVCDNALATMKVKAPRDTGELADSLEIEHRGPLDSVIVGNALHTEPVLVGSGIYGPKKRRIVAKNART